MSGISCIPLAANVLCGLGMVFGVAMLVLGALVGDRKRGYFLMIVGLLSCVAANFTWLEVASLGTCT